MSTPASQNLRQEADLMERFAQSYRRKFAALIQRLNGEGGAPAPSDMECMRLCVEAVDMMLASQSQVAKTLREMAPPAPVKRAA